MADPALSLRPLGVYRSSGWPEADTTPRLAYTRKEAETLAANYLTRHELELARTVMALYDQQAVVRAEQARTEASLAALRACVCGFLDEMREIHRDSEIGPWAMRFVRRLHRIGEL